MRVSTDQEERKPRDRVSAKGGFVRLLGFFLLVVACLMLTFTPEQLFRAWHHDGYTRTEAQVLSQAGPDQRSVKLRIAATGATLMVRRTRLAKGATQGPEAVWYNPAARLVLGIEWFDERVISSEMNPGGLPELASAVLLFLGNLALGAFSLYLAFGPERSGGGGQASRRRSSGS